VERVFIHGLTPHLSELSRAGMSPHGIAAELSVVGPPQNVAIA